MCFNMQVMCFDICQAINNMLLRHTFVARFVEYLTVHVLIDIHMNWPCMHGWYEVMAT